MTVLATVAAIALFSRGNDAIATYSSTKDIHSLTGACTAGRAIGTGVAVFASHSVCLVNISGTFGEVGILIVTALSQIAFSLNGATHSGGMRVVGTHGGITGTILGWVTATQ